MAARYNPGQRRDGNGMWTDDGIPNRRRRSSRTGGGGDRLGVAQRAGFTEGEQVLLSNRLRSSTGYNDVDYALVADGQGNTELRIHTGGDSDWSGANEWTAQLDPDQVAELRGALTEAAEQARRRRAEVGDDWDDDRIAEGSVGDEWGSVHWSTWLTDGTGGWEMSVSTSAGATADEGSDGAQLTPAQVNRLAGILGQAEGVMGGDGVNAARRVKAATLGTIPNVELARTGSWALSSGQWNPKPEDFAAAVAALNCPAVRAARIRLGHVDPRFDGEPAVGSVTNLRTENGGHSLVGDLSQVPGWLPNVINAAYPDRSVEGVYGHVCQVGHTHPFVLTGLALLGVTAPGVGTLRSIDDVGVMYGMTGQPVAATFQGEVSAAQDREHWKRYWTKDPEGLAKWAKDDHPWTALYRHLKKRMPDEMAKRAASDWYHVVFGRWPGERKGKNKNGPG